MAITSYQFISRYQDRIAGHAVPAFLDAKQIVFTANDISRIAESLSQAQDRTVLQERTEQFQRLIHELQRTVNRMEGYGIGQVIPGEMKENYQNIAATVAEQAALVMQRIEEEAHSRKTSKQLHDSVENILRDLQPTIADASINVFQSGDLLRSILQGKEQDPATDPLNIATQLVDDDFAAVTRLLKIRFRILNVHEYFQSLQGALSYQEVTAIRHTFDINIRALTRLVLELNELTMKSSWVPGCRNLLQWTLILNNCLTLAMPSSIPRRKSFP